MIGVDGVHAVHVFGEVEDDGGVAALAGEGGAGSAGEEGSVDGAAGCDGGDDVGFVAGDDDADGDVAIVGAVGGVEGFGGGVEATSPRMVARSALECRLRESRGALTARQAATVAMTSASSRGMTTPMGMWR